MRLSHRARKMRKFSIMSGRVEKLWLKRSHRGPMDEVQAVAFVAGQGVAGSVDRSRRRQVTLLALEDWNAAIREAGAAVDPSFRRANLLVSGVSLEGTRGRVLQIGTEVTLAVGGELTPCERMEEVHPGLQRALRPFWRGGVFAQVLSGGFVRVGDEIAWAAEETEDAAPSSLRSSG
jgi:MOSC domain-containing protein YiiM